jgi:hypothetical protein
MFRPAGGTTTACVAAIATHRRAAAALAPLPPADPPRRMLSFPVPRSHASSRAAPLKPGHGGRRARAGEPIDLQGVDPRVSPTTATGRPRAAIADRLVPKHHPGPRYAQKRPERVVGRFYGIATRPTPSRAPGPGYAAGEICRFCQWPSGGSSCFRGRRAALRLSRRGRPTGSFRSCTHTCFAQRTRKARGSGTVFHGLEPETRQEMTGVANRTTKRRGRGGRGLHEAGQTAAHEQFRGVVADRSISSASLWRRKRGRCRRMVRKSCIYR